MSPYSQIRSSTALDEIDFALGSQSCTPIATRALQNDLQYFVSSPCAIMSIFIGRQLLDHELERVALSVISIIISFQVHLKYSHHS